MKHLFNFNLYKDGIKRLRTMGFIYLVLVVFLFLVRPIGEYIDYFQTLQLGELLQEYKLHYDAYSFMGFLVIPFYFASFIFTFMTFGFLNARNSSDFYHSIPHKRITLYASYTFSILTWLAAIIFVPCIIISIPLKLISSTFVFEALPLFACALNMFIGSTLIVTITSLACFITGTTFSSVILSLMLVFLPRSILQIFIALITDSIPMVFNFNDIFFLRDDINIVTAFMFADESLLTNLGAHTIYTIILCIIFFAISAFAYTKRNSEAAGNSTINKKAEVFVLLITGFIVSLPSLLIIFEHVVYFGESELINPTTIFAFVINLIGIIAAIFVYKLMTSKKVILALKTIILTPFIIIFDAVILGLMIFLFNYALNFTPTPNEIDYIRFEKISYNDYSNNYLFDKIKQIEFTDNEIKEFVSDTLIDNIDRLKADYFLYDDDEITVVICSNGTEYTRKLFVYDSLYNDLVNILIECDEFSKILTSLPDINDNNVSFEYHDLNYEESKEIYEILKNEIINNPTPLLMSMFRNYSVDELNFKISDNGTIYRLSLPIISDYPLSYIKYLEKSNKYLAYDENEVITILSNLDTYLYEGEYVYIQIYGRDSSVMQNVTPIDLNYHITITDDLVKYLRNKDSFTESEAATILRKAGYPTEKDIETFEKLADAIKNKNYDSSYTLFWISINKESINDYYDSYSTPVLLPNDYFTKIQK